MSFNLPILVHNSSPPALSAGQSAPLQGDAAGNLLVNQRLLTLADIATVQNSGYGQLFANVALSGGDQNPIGTVTPTGGVFLLKVATADTRTIFYQPPATAVSASGNSGDLTTAHLRELSIDISCTAVAGGGSLALVLARKGQDGVYYPVVALGSIAAVGTVSYSVGPGLASNHSLGAVCRLQWTLTGTSVTCSMNVQGKT